MIKKNIFSVIVAFLLSVSILSFNCSAFTFDGENRSLTDIYSDWFLSTRDFVTGNSTFEEWRNDNIRFQTDIIGSNLFPGSDLEFQSYINEIEEKLRTAAEGTDNKVDDTFLDILGSAVETVGIFNFREQFETWYQDKYGKKYGAHDSPFEYPSGCNYYIYFNYGGTQNRYYVNASIPKSVPVQYKDGKYFLRFRDIPNVNSFRRYAKYGDTWYTLDDPVNFNAYYVDPAGFYGIAVGINCTYNGYYTLTSTNLPLDFSGGSDDIPSDVPSVDTDSEFTGDIVAPTITLPEIGDLLTDLDNDLKNTDPDSDNPNKGVEIKITQLTNKLHNDLSKVIEYLKKIFEKITNFFDNFFDRLGDFFQSVFIPQDDYFNNVIMDIKAEFDEVFSFGISLKSNVDYFLDCYNTTPSNSFTLGGYKISFAIFDKVIYVIRYTIAIPIYFGFVFRTYRKLPVYIKGGASE